MKQTLPSLVWTSGMAVIASLLVFPGGVVAQEPPPVAVLAPNPDGQKLVANAARRVFQEPSLEAKVRHRVDLLGHELFGTGLYQQLGAGPDKLVRFEMKTQLDDQTVTLQQISGERFFWIRKDLPQGKKKLSRVSLWQFREGVKKIEATNPLHASQCWLLLGGLSRLLEELNRGYTFGPPQAGELGSVPVWVLTGEAKPELRARLDIPVERKTPQFPVQVVLTLGRDNILPLFPYRVEYQRTNKSGVLEPLMTMELYEVRRRNDLDPRSFEYNPGDQEVEDITRPFLLRLGIQ